MSILIQKDDQAIAFTAISNNQTISGGQLVKAMSVAQVATDWSNLEVDIADAAGDENVTVGLALTNAASGALVSVAMEGFYTMFAGEAALPAGRPIVPAAAEGGSAVRDATDAYLEEGSKTIGHALSTAADTQRVAVALRL